MGKRKDDRQKNPAAVALGSIKSAKKAAASRANGMLGGRPKKTSPKQNRMVEAWNTRSE